MKGKYFAYIALASLALGSCYELGVHNGRKESANVIIGKLKTSEAIVNSKAGYWKIEEEDKESLRILGEDIGNLADMVEGTLELNDVIMDHLRAIRPEENLED